jgi:mono/diheme cytochrome c family protein
MNKLLSSLGFTCLLTVIAGCDRHDASIPAVTNPEVLLASRPAASFAADVTPMLSTHCVKCHDAGTASGGVILEWVEGVDATPRDVALWGRVADVLRAGTMPPRGKPRPDPASLATVNSWIESEVFRCGDPNAINPGRVTLRRLNRAEYDNTIRDLFGLDLRPADRFPADDVGYGFDSIGDVLSMPPILMEKYLDAANAIVKAVSHDPAAWSRIMHPPVDEVPRALRSPIIPVRTYPNKLVGIPKPKPPEDPEVTEIRRIFQVIRGVADLAYRRPATEEELTRLEGLVEAAHRDGMTREQGVQDALIAILISPSFLFRAEPNQPDADGSNYPVNDFELASRLSYFLWSSLPDDELYRLATRGELRKGDNLARQVRRMLRDEKARALLDGFALQWLQIRSLKDATPDPSRFPEFDQPLRKAMFEETSRLARSILLEDGPISDFLDADYSFVNERLARHYGIPGVVGDEFRRVSLAGSHRRGVMTHASVLTVTSSPDRTSPVKRGKWVLDNLLGMPPPPPPEGVEALKPEQTGGRTATLRQRMERHRVDPKCASCHARMDPLGFALESFDGIGGWRSAEGGEPIDDSATLPGGESFGGASGLHDVLIARRQSFAHCLTEKMLTYAIGRGLGPADRCFVDEIARKLERGDGRSSALIMAIVESPPFQSRAKVTP